MHCCKSGIPITVLLPFLPDTLACFVDQLNDVS